MPRPSAPPTVAAMTGIAQVPAAASERIVKRRRADVPAPNVADYDAARDAFTWARARTSLSGLPGGRGLNIAHEAVDRHAAGDLAAKTAVR